MGCRSLFVPVALVVAIASCASSRDRVPSPLITWNDDIAAVVRTHCATASCHAGAAPSASYDLTSYLGALGPGLDPTANAIAGDDGSLILRHLETPSHAVVADQLPLLRSWVVDSNLAYQRSRIHAPGLLDQASAEFHGQVLEDLGWTFAQCQRCHGADFAGSSAAPTCLGCHARGPTHCETCHGTGPISGAHPRHAGAGVACGECHVVPTRWDEPGHLLDEGGAVIGPPARVTLGALANRDLAMPRRTAPASYDPTTQRCSAVYCHGGVLGDPAAAEPSPTWNGGEALAACGTCHGRPPASHAQSECVVCHATTIDANDVLSARHIDAVIDVGDGSTGCAACHGASTGSAPPRGLHGEALASELAVGAHRAHLEAHRLRGPIPCNECHRVPTAVGDAGHLDTALPAELTFGALSMTDAASPSWNRSAATCSGVYCHGGGAGLLAEPSPGKQVVPSWTATTAQTVYCGACHGLPPSDTFHASNLELTDCAGCHARSIGPFGDILFTGPPAARTSTHINGIVDFL